MERIVKIEIPQSIQEARKYVTRKKRAAVRGKSGKHLKNVIIPRIEKRYKDSEAKNKVLVNKLKASEHNNLAFQRNMEIWKARYEIALGVAKNNRKKLPGLLHIKKVVVRKPTKRQLKLIERGKVREKEKQEFAQEAIEQKVNFDRKYHPAVNCIFGQAIVEAYIREHLVKPQNWRIFVICSQYNWFTKKDLKDSWGCTPREINMALDWMEQLEYIEKFTEYRAVAYSFLENGHKRMAEYMKWFMKKANELSKNNPDTMPAGSVSIKKVKGVRK